MLTLFPSVTYWTYLGTIYLIIFLYLEIKKKSYSQSTNKNYFMSGLSVSLISHFYNNIWYLLVGIILITVIHIIHSRFLSAPIANSLLWVLMGFMIIGPFYFIAAELGFLLLYLGYVTLAKLLYGNFLTKLLPSYSVVLVTYAIMCIVFGLY